VLFLLAFLTFGRTSNAADIADLNFRLSDNELYLSTVIKPDEKIMADMNDGLTKEFTFYLDLFRVWNIWPDEFVLGQKITTTLMSNPIKREYIATSVNGSVLVKKRFQDPESMINWAMTLSDIKLTNIKGLDEGTYFIKVTAESRLRKLPPVIGYLLFFMTDKEFSISKNSAQFQINMKENQP